MKILENKSNVVVVEINFYFRVMFSYTTAVAAYKDGKYYRTEEFHSVTTSKHLNKWLHGCDFTEKPQEWFDNLC